MGLTNSSYSPTLFSNKNNTNYNTDNNTKINNEQTQSKQTTPPIEFYKSRANNKFASLERAIGLELQ